MLCAAVYKSPQRLWSDTYIIELLGFRNKSMPAGNQNVKQSVWNSQVLNPSDLNLLELFVHSSWNLSPTMLYTLHSWCERWVQDIVVHQNIRLSELTVTDIVDSHHLTSHVSSLGPVRMRTTLDPVEKLTDWMLHFWTHIFSKYPNSLFWWSW